MRRPLRFKVDENLPLEIADILRAKGYDATTARDERLTGKPDGDLADVCRNEDRIIVSMDLHFADIRSYPPSQYPGSIVLRLRRENKEAILGAIQEIIRAFSAQSPHHRLWIFETGHVRIRNVK